MVFILPNLGSDTTKGKNASLLFSKSCAVKTIIQQTMPVPWKTVRLFISSTFQDMHSERDYLVRFVFPKLREELLKYRIHFIDIDLRWGISSDQDTLSVCREMIDECRPRFLCMIGGRYGTIPSGKSHSITVEEIKYGVLDRSPEDRTYAYFYFRDPMVTDAMVEATPGEFREATDSENETKLLELKEQIMATGLTPFTYSAEWDNTNRRLTGLQDFGRHVYDNLIAGMQKDPTLQLHFNPDTFETSGEFADENATMEAFIQERSEYFFLGSRKPVLQALLSHVKETNNDSCLCLTGGSGSGKSTLLAYLSHLLSSQDDPAVLLIGHFTGTSPGSTSVRNMLQRLCYELKEGVPNIRSDIPLTLNKLEIAFSDFLRQACQHKRVIILIDAVNQLNPAFGFNRLQWLPEEVPANARIILSLLAGPPLEELRSLPQKVQEIELEPLTKADGAGIIEQYCHRYGKQLESVQRTALLSKVEADTPLYLLVALEELRMLGTFKDITQRIIEFPHSSQALFRWVLKRLENDDGFRTMTGELMGRELVPQFASLLGVSRNGLSYAEIVDILDPGDPLGNIAALLHLLRPYLMRRGELLDFYHDSFRQAAHNMYLTEEQQRYDAHAVLGDYFAGLRLSKMQEAKPRILTELPFQYIESKKWEIVDDLLCRPAFPRSKRLAGLSLDLLADYERAIRLCAEAAITRTDLRNLLIGLETASRVMGGLIATYSDDDLQIMVRLGLEELVIQILSLRSNPLARLESCFRVYQVMNKEGKAVDVLIRVMERALGGLSESESPIWQALIKIILAIRTSDPFDTNRAAQLKDQLRAALQPSPWKTGLVLAQRIEQITSRETAQLLIANIVNLLPSIPSEDTRIKMARLLARLQMSDQLLQVIREELKMKKLLKMDMGPSLHDIINELQSDTDRSALASMLGSLLQQYQDPYFFNYADLIARFGTPEALETIIRLADLNGKARVLAELAAAIFKKDEQRAISLAKKAITYAQEVQDQYERSTTLSDVTRLLAEGSLLKEANLAADLALTATAAVRTWKATMSDLASPAAYGSLVKALLAVNRTSEVERIISSGAAGDARMRYHAEEPLVSRLLSEKKYDKALAIAQKASDQYGTQSRLLSEISLALLADNRFAEAQNIIAQTRNTELRQKPLQASAEYLAKAYQIEEAQQILASIQDPKYARETVHNITTELIRAGKRAAAEDFFFQIREKRSNGNTLAWASALRELGYSYMISGRRSAGLFLLNKAQHAIKEIDNNLQWIAWLRKLAVIYVKVDCQEEAKKIVSEVWKKVQDHYRPLDMDDERDLNDLGRQAYCCAAEVANELKSQGHHREASAFTAKLPSLYYSYGSIEEFMQILADHPQQDGLSDQKEKTDKLVASIAKRLRLPTEASLADILHSLSVNKVNWGFSRSVTSSGAMPSWQILWENNSKEIIVLAELLFEEGRLQEGLGILGDCELDYLIILFSTWNRKPALQIGLSALEKVIDILTWVRLDWKLIARQLQEIKESQQAT